MTTPSETQWEYDTVPAPPKISPNMIQSQLNVTIVTRHRIDNQVPPRLKRTHPDWNVTTPTETQSDYDTVPAPPKISPNMIQSQLNVKLDVE